MKKPLPSVPFTFIVVAAICSLIQMGCDRDNPASVPQNSQPVIEGIGDIVLDAGAETTVEVNVTDADSDDTHTIQASSDDTAIVTVSVSNPTLTIRGIAGGVTAITVTARDDSEQDNARSQPVTFQVTVDRNSQPVIEGIGDIVVDAGAEATVEVNVTDADSDDTQTIEASSDDTAIATVSVSNSTLTIRGIAGGVTAITVTATDDSEQDNARSQPVSFQVTVTESPPEPGKFSDFNEGWDNADIWRSMDANGEIVACREGLRLPRDSFCLDENFRFSSDYSQLLDTRFLVAHLPDGDGLVLQGRTQFRAGGSIQLGWITLEKIGSERVITHLDP